MTGFPKTKPASRVYGEHPILSNKMKLADRSQEPGVRIQNNCLNLTEHLKRGEPCAVSLIMIWYWVVGEQALVYPFNPV